MLLATLQHFRCTLGEVREDYWMGRVWRALTGDPALQGRVARQGVSTILLTGAGYDVPPASAKERDRWRLHVEERVVADTGRSLRALGILVQWATGPVVVQRARVVSLIAQAVDRGPRWGDLTAWVGDLAPVVAPVVVAVGTPPTVGSRSTARWPTTPAAGSPRPRTPSCGLDRLIRSR